MVRKLRAPRSTRLLTAASRQAPALAIDCEVCDLDSGDGSEDTRNARRGHLLACHNRETREAAYHTHHETRVASGGRNIRVGSNRSVRERGCDCVDAAPERVTMQTGQVVTPTEGTAPSASAQTDGERHV